MTTLKITISTTNRPVQAIRDAIHARLPSCSVNVHPGSVFIRRAGWPVCQEYRLPKALAGYPETVRAGAYRLVRIHPRDKRTEAVKLEESCYVPPELVIIKTGGTYGSGPIARVGQALDADALARFNPEPSKG